MKAVLIVLDGFGIGKDSPFNAIKNARMPFYRDLMSRYPHAQLLTHGEAVGLPDGVMGNSEVGHMTMGAGRIIYQDLTRISKHIQTGEFFKNPILNETLTTTLSHSGRLHVMGLLSDAGVHSHLDHLVALLELCHERQIPEVWIHAFLDGRDTPPDSSPGFVTRLQNEITRIATQSGSPTRVKIASLGGRYYAMDRDKRWERVEAAYRAMTGQVTTAQTHSPLDPLSVIHTSHQNGKSDEFVEPVLLESQGALKDGDGVIFFNYRADRAREISAALSEPGFLGFNRGRGFKPCIVTGFTRYDDSLTHLKVAFGPQNLDHLFGELLEEKKLGQFRIAETEKYAHVTFFFNGGREKPYQGEDRLLIASPKDVPTYDLKPEMSARDVAREAARALQKNSYSFLLMNFANADMVGHTGNYLAAVQAMECLDECLGIVVGAAQKADYHVIITADHGNCEEMDDGHGKIHTQHTLNPVPVIWVAPNTAIAPKAERKSLRDGTLADLYPTLCQLMNLPIPPEVTGRSLLP